ncbi:MAG: RNA polymerase sigma-70 factor [Terrimesophilobacter sp.]
MNESAFEEFEAHRGRLFGIAYRMFGTVSEAEDVVQEAWLRWQGADRDAVLDPAAYLATIATRLSIAELTSARARARRETYVGPWLPEPVDTSKDPLLGAERAEALSMAVLVLLEKLTPNERAAFVLHEAFAYPHSLIAEMLEVSEENARQLFSRARKSLASDRVRPVTTAERDRLLGAFLAAAQNGSLEELESILAADVVTISDGGGFVTAARKHVVGPERVAIFMLGVREKFGHGIRPVYVTVNGGPGWLAVRDGVPIALWTVQASADGVRRVFMMLNPHKLSRFEELASLS